MTRLIDKDDLISFLERVFPDNVIEGVTSTTLFKQIIQDIRCQPIVMPEERPKDDNLCDTCKKYYECPNSSKIAPNFYVTKCCKYEGGRQ